MHLDGRSRLRPGTAGNRLCRWLAVLFPATVASSIFGQGLLQPPPGFQGAPKTDSVLPAPGANGVDQYLNPATSTPPGTETANGQENAAPGGDDNAPKEVGRSGAVDTMMRWSAAHVRLRGSYQFLYVTGIHTGPGTAADTITQTVAPGLTLLLGPHVTFDYSPAYRVYTQHAFHDTLDHSLSLNASGYVKGDWMFGMSQTLMIADEPLAETGGQTEQQDYRTDLNAVYSVNEKLSLKTDLDVDFEFINENTTNVFVGGTNGVPSPLSDTRSYKGTETLDYRFNDFFRGGMAASLGYNEQLNGFRSVEEEYNAYLNWRPGPKLTASISGGLEERNFLNTKATAVWNPIYSADISYRAFQHTVLSVFANQSVNVSIFDKEFTKSTGVGAGLEQRLLEKMRLALLFNYRKTDFLSTDTSDLATSRSDKVTSASASLSFPILKRCSLATFYQYSHDRSSQKGYSYNSTQIGVTLFWAY